MNLIDQLGGYEAAKEKLTLGNRVLATRLSYETTIVGKDGEKQNVITGVYLEDLEKALLTYRREHNIYEAGDLVLTNDPASKGRVYKIIFKRGEHYKLQSDTGVRYCREWRIDRHATDEEIANNARSE